MTTRSQGINRKIPILISVLLLQSVAITINASNDGFSGESHFSHPPDDVDLTPWTIDCYDDFEATWIWQSDNQPTGIDSPTDSDFGFSGRFGVGITDLEDGTFELENSDGDTEIWDGWTNGTTIQIPDISNLSRTYACYAEEFQWDDDTWRFSHNSTCENEYFLDSDNTFAVFDQGSIRFRTFPRTTIGHLTGKSLMMAQSIIMWRNPISRSMAPPTSGI